MFRFFRNGFRSGASVLVPMLVSLAGFAEDEVRIARSHPAGGSIPHPIDPALEMARASLQHSQAEVKDYTGLFVKRCRVDGELPPLQFAKLKIRNRKFENGVLVTPMGVYLDFVKPADIQGREVIWLEGANEGNMIVHQGGVARFVTLTIDPTGYLAMRGQRYPVTDIGIENLLLKIIETAERDRRYDECEVQMFPDAKIGEDSCTMVQVTHPVERPHFDFHIAQVFFSHQLKMPIRYKSWTWPSSPGAEPEIQEEYNYLKLNLNVGLTDHDFDAENPAYRFY
jgi:hypothetical protein